MVVYVTKNSLVGIMESVVNDHNMEFVRGLPEENYVFHADVHVERRKCSRPPRDGSFVSGNQ